MKLNYLNKTKVDWDYSSLAKTYDKRADYSEKLVFNILNETGNAPWKPVIEIGAGTGKLTKLLCKAKLKVTAVEPNIEMRKIGKKNIKNCDWIDGSAEKTNVNGNYYSAFFGSSFNVVNHKKTIKELNRILFNGSKIICLFNHRNLNDNIQKQIEMIIKKNIKNYDYGTRRKDLRPILKKLGCFKDIKYYEDNFNVKYKLKDIVDAFKSHGTIKIQSKSKFNLVINEIQDFLVSLGKKSLYVPYKTVAYSATFKKNDNFQSIMYRETEN